MSDAKVGLSKAALAKAVADSPVGKAMAETDKMIASARAETKNRRMWGYVRNDTLIEWAKAHQSENVRELASQSALLTNAVDVAPGPCCVVCGKPTTNSRTDSLRDPGSEDCQCDDPTLGEKPASTPSVFTPNEHMTKLARLYYNRPEDTVVEVGHDAAVNKYMFAVWMGEEPKPTVEPQF